MMNNGAPRVCLFLLLTVLVLIGIGELPPLSLAGYEVKRVDALARILPPETPAGEEPLAEEEVPAGEGDAEPSPQDSLPGEQPVYIDTVPPPPGMQPIEDYADTVPMGMDPFYAALAAAGSLGRPVRIAFYGDSFVEGDILTADLREALQQAYGGEGVGFVDVASPFIKYKSTVRHKATGWTDYSILERDKANRERAGLSGRCALAEQAGASVSYKGVGEYEGLASWSVATAYVTAEDTVEVTALLNATDTVSLPLAAGGQVQALTWRGRMSQFTMLAPCAGFIAYGVALEGERGIVVDNFSLRGCSGAALEGIPLQRLKQFARLRPCDLIVLQFGLNVAERERTDYTYYTAQMKRVIAHLHTAYPQAGILVMSVGDRADRFDGELQTMPGVKALVRQQQRLAEECGVAFWNAFEAMGGGGGIVGMAERGEAGTDYTHITRRGGKRVAGAFVQALQFGYEEYERKKYALSSQHDQE